MQERTLDIPKPRPPLQQLSRAPAFPFLPLGSRNASRDVPRFGVVEVFNGLWCIAVARLAPEVDQEEGVFVVWMLTEAVVPGEVDGVFRVGRRRRRHDDNRGHC